MAVFTRSRQQVERIIAIARVALAASTLLAVWLDPEGSAWFAQAGLPLNLGYLSYALVLLGLSLVHRSGNVEIVFTQIIDTAAFLVFTHLTLGSSPFFLYLVFSMFCAALRWGWRGTLLTSAVVLLAFLAISLPADASSSPEFQINRTIARIVFLVMCGGMLAYLGLYEARLHDEIERLARWPRDLGATLEGAVERILTHAGQLLGATRTLLVWEFEDDPAVHVAFLNGGTLRLTTRTPADLPALMPPASDGCSFVAPEGAGSSAPIIQRDARGDISERAGLSLPPDVQTMLEVPGLVSAPFGTDRTTGRVYFDGIPSASVEILPLAEVVAREIASSLDQMRVSHQLKEVAVREERIRLSRDLHDGVLQSLTGIRLELTSVADSLAGREDAVRARLVGLERALAIEQRELRFFIRGIKPAAMPLADEDSLEARLDALKERLALEWTTPVSIRIAPESHVCPGNIAKAVPLMVHEAVVNALKHAKPTRVNVNVEGTSERLRIVVSDDGQGFRFKGLYDHRALGESQNAPRSLFDRVSALGGKMSIESSEAGSRIEMVVSI